MALPGVRPRGLALVEVIELLVAEAAGMDDLVVGLLESEEQLVQLHLERLRISVLGVLQHDHHQQRHEGHAAGDEQLPGSCRPGADPDPCPDHHEPECDREGLLRASVVGDEMGESVPGVHQTPIPKTAAQALRLM